ncbi:Alpha-L-arabinofuranosidase C-terminus [Chryseolinea serpens]|uniref:non-reducing end alpha-L-arabinofuranosidase n=1 Tax=Chryseolinea serpens TaxID=947013 RepID=A0A1M5M192_9BACT|nr:alpha-L-arabinofuranosidase C-terminal domain-containing protein [Chryseolinea serpens]SHG71102.1 Alpha-L-arabinofuranosidase C-terminus [Chryseolinea serpens]
MKRMLSSLLLVLLWGLCPAQSPTIVVEADQPGAKVSPDLHGIFFEEISHGGEGGLYAELIQNRGFEESRVPEGCTLDSGFIIPPQTPHYGAGRVVDWKMPFEPKTDYPAWSLQAQGAEATMALDLTHPLHKETPRSLRVEIARIGEAGKVAVINEGFWGIKVEEGATYELTLYNRTRNYKGNITARLVGRDGKILSEKVFEKINALNWTKFTTTLSAKASDEKATFQLSFSATGTVWLEFVSLFPTKTFKNRKNGLRPDLAQYLADLKPAFVRWPGGCFVEGISTQSAPNWRRSLGPVEQRSGTYSPWGYWSSDGLGYHEFLQFCEDIDAKAMYVFNCGIACEMRSGVYVDDKDVGPILTDVLNAIEYAIGPKESTWGSLRARNGHPEPFPLHYVEVGNEQVGEPYGKRFNIFYEAINAKYPELEIVAAMGIAHLSKPTIASIRKMDLADEHAYKAAGWAMAYPDWYDQYERKDWKLYVGEYACNGGVGSGNMTAALNDATFILGLERNSDLITMSSYAPLLENINDTDWPVNLIRFDQARSFARISYYAIQMLNENKASFNLTTKVDAPVDNDTPSFRGNIGLSTWDTQAEYKDIEVIKDGKTIYKGAPGMDQVWNFEGGQWSARDNVLAQTQDGAWPLATLKDQSFDRYILKVKAKKTGGTNAFMIPFALRDNQNYLRAHIGAWVNKIAAFESVTKGADAIVTQPVRLENAIELNRWYTIELHVNNNTVECFLDGKLLMTYTKPKDFFSIAGRDEKTNEIVVKVVNATGGKRNVLLKINKAQLENTGKAITLSSGSPEDENSFAQPRQFIPQETMVNGVASNFEYEFQPWSITVLRLKEKR